MIATHTQTQTQNPKTYVRERDEDTWKRDIEQKGRLNHVHFVIRPFYTFCFPRVKSFPDKL